MIKTWTIPTSCPAVINIPALMSSSTGNVISATYSRPTGHKGIIKSPKRNAPPTAKTPFLSNRTNVKATIDTMEEI